MELGILERWSPLHRWCTPRSCLCSMSHLHVLTQDPKGLGLLLEVSSHKPSQGPSPMSCLSKSLQERSNGMCHRPHDQGLSLNFPP